MQSLEYVREGHCLLSLCVGERTLFTLGTPPIVVSLNDDIHKGRAGGGDDGTFLKSTTPYFRFLFLFTIEEICVHVNGRFLDRSSFVFCHVHLARAIFLYVWGLPSLHRKKTHSDLLDFKLPFWQSLCPFGFHYALLAFTMSFWLLLCPFGFHSVLLLHFSSNSALLAVTMTHSALLESLRPFWQSLGTFGSHSGLLAVTMPFLTVTPPFWKSYCPFWQLLRPIGSHTAFLANAMSFWQSLCPFGSHSALLAVTLPFWQSLCTLWQTLPSWPSLCTFGSQSALFLAVILSIWQ